MRNLFLKDKHIALGAQVKEKNGVEYISSYSSIEDEYKLTRDAVSLTDFSFTRAYSIPEEDGIDFLDEIFPGNVATLRFGRVLHTFLSNDNGEVLADCYIANNDDEFIIICESLLSDDELDAIFENAGGSKVGLKEINSTHTILNIDGYRAWEVAKDLFDLDVLGLPYLSVERYDLNDKEFALIRSGKTGEFGYTLIIENENAIDAFDTILESVKKCDGGVSGFDAHETLRLDGRFFNVYSEGSLIKDPLKMGLQWMIDPEKDGYIGFDAISTRRESGLTEKLIGIKGEKNSDNFIAGAKLFSGGEEVGEIKSTCYSPVLDTMVGLAIFPYNIAYAGVSFTIGESGEVINTISMPPFSPKSLSVRLDEM